ncbi:hypothetical protein [Chromatocurvus halotolerans]|uniref:Tetratricopeptide repeat protein n=1 Tax=Chromatocurvus halotolerans TaxID=1132028 RepID=A0A4R2L783_9GAMM|nr:hypothetical protein [Chromatocurvus halotolerans]TCO78528.1 hypothetical protein EV688_101345 [Chromatocurvus halotolerans]
MTNAHQPHQTTEASPRWRQLVESANAEFRNGRLQRSAELYARAARVLDKELAGQRLTAAFLLAKVITLQNWAAALARLGDLGAADLTYRRAHGLVREITQDSQQPPQLRAIALRQCKVTLAEWSAMHDRCGPWEGRVLH